MRAMILEAARSPLRLAELPPPEPGPEQVLLWVHACGVCRTDLHVADGELPDPKLPLVLGHEVVGTVVRAGARVERLAAGARVGVPWLGWTCRAWPYCLSGRATLFPPARLPRYQLDGGYAEYAVADHSYAFVLPDYCGAAEAAPLLCAGLIGYRSLRLAGDARRLGLYGFGAAAHLVAQVARHQGRQVYAFTRPGGAAGQQFARALGAVWAGGSDELPPEKLDAALLFAPVGALVPQALRAVARGGVGVCAGIHQDRIPGVPFPLLWGGGQGASVGNLTGAGGGGFPGLGARGAGGGEVETFPLEEANEALARLRAGRVRGAAVLLCGRPAG